jgi:hemerythrin-like domain-containing protein
MSTDLTPQLRLPGQAYVAEGPHDQTGMYVMHHALRRDLDHVQRAVRGTPVDDVSTWRLLQRRWGRFAEILHHHHRVEDESMWPLLLQHVADDPPGQELLHAMEAEHARMDPALAACAAAFAAMVDHPCEEHRADLAGRVAATHETLLAHLAHEETETLPLLQRTLSTEEFAQCEKAAERAYPLRMVPFLLPWAMDGLPPDAKQRMLGVAGPVYAVALRLLDGRYRRGEARAFRHA